MSRKTTIVPKSTMIEKDETVTVDKPTSRRRTPSLPPAPPAPGPKLVHKERREGPEANLQRAEQALTNVVETYAIQQGHPGNVMIDFRPFHTKMAELDGIYTAKGFSKTKRDLGYDWVGFTRECQELVDDILRAAIGVLQEKADRMVWTGDIDPKTEKDTIDELWAEADDEKIPLKKQVWLWSSLIKKLRARGCTDPEEQTCGGRQSGGSRRRG